MPTRDRRAEAFLDCLIAEGLLALDECAHWHDERNWLCLGVWRSDDRRACGCVPVADMTYKDVVLYLNGEGQLPRHLSDPARAWVIVT